MSRRLTAAVFPLAFLLACRGTPALPLPAQPRAATAQPTPVAAQPTPAAAQPTPAVAQPTSTTAPATSGDALRHRVARALADPAVAAGTWGVEVRSLVTGKTLVDAGAHRLLTPASTLKTVTLAVAADQLGWDYTYETRAVPGGTITNGVLEGDLVVVGSGDPSFDDWDGAASRVFESWAAQLRERGITAIGGRIVGNDDVFADEGLGAGWMWDDMAFGYS
ncbi:MAG TPA: D-alanyl-D-alanine carboxypeptidase, partial [Aeromicrobium sp.]|nr:D-alanyl-D-alanine carboxypeptidase [Aeromicrobium sp.]